MNLYIGHQKTSLAQFMAKQSDTQSHEERVSTEISSRLRAGQSKRTTFRLSPAAVEAKEWLSNYWGVPKKAVLGEIPALIKILSEKDALQSAEPWKPSPTWKRSSYVISTLALRELNNLVRKTGWTRDALVNIGLLWLAKGEKDRLAEYPARLDKAEALIGEGYSALLEIERKVKDLLGPGDPVTNAVGLGLTGFDIDTQKELDLQREKIEEARKSLEEAS